MRCALEITVADRQDLAPLQRAQSLEAMVVALRRDQRLLGCKQIAGLFLTPEHDQRLGLAQPGIRAERPLERIDHRGQRRERATGVTAGDQHARLLQGQLALHGGRPALQQVVHLGAKPAGDHPKNAGGWLASTKLHLVQESPAEITAADLGEAHATVVPKASNALAEGLGPGHRGIIPDVKRGFTGL